MGNEAGIQIRRVLLDEILDLRHVVLRAGLPRETAIFTGDDLSTSRHYGAFLRDPARTGAVGCATFHLNKWENEPAWQLRGMATADDFRQRGLGRAMLAIADADILGDSSAPRLFWCNARVPAIGFYQRMGWTVVSDPFEIPTAGPHVRMFRRV